MPDAATVSHRALMGRCALVGFLVQLAAVPIWGRSDAARQFQDRGGSPQHLVSGRRSNSVQCSAAGWSRGIAAPSARSDGGCVSPHIARG
jgi:hypothetical protein